MNLLKSLSKMRATSKQDLQQRGGPSSHCLIQFDSSTPEDIQMKVRPKARYLLIYFTLIHYKNFSFKNISFISQAFCLLPITFY